MRKITLIKVFTADWIFDGTGRPPIDKGVILVEADEIIAVGNQSQIKIPQGSDVTQIDLFGILSDEHGKLRKDYSVDLEDSDSHPNRKAFKSLDEDLFFKLSRIVDKNNKQ